MIVGRHREFDQRLKKVEDTQRLAAIESEEDDEEDEQPSRARVSLGERRNPHMFVPDYGFPMSKPMLGFPIPGPLVEVPRVRVSTYPDGTDHALAVHRKRAAVNPIVQYPTMNEDHGKGHLYDQLLKTLTHGHPHPEAFSRLKKLIGSQAPKLSEGYEAAKENRMWRQS